MFSFSFAAEEHFPPNNQLGPSPSDQTYITSTWVSVQHPWMATIRTHTHMPFIHIHTAAYIDVTYPSFTSQQLNANKKHPQWLPFLSSRNLLKGHQHSHRMKNSLAHTLWSTLAQQGGSLWALLGQFKYQECFALRGASEFVSFVLTQSPQRNVFFFTSKIRCVDFAFVKHTRSEFTQRRRAKVTMLHFLRTLVYYCICVCVVVCGCVCEAVAQPPRECRQYMLVWVMGEAIEGEFVVVVFAYLLFTPEM